MTVQLHDIRPEPLVSTGINPRSDLFATEVNFEPGKSYLIIANSGKGKSTLLHILYGLRSDYSGRVLLDGRGGEQFSPDDWAELRQQKLSIVFQDLRLFPDLTALENIQLNNTLTSHKSEAQIRAMCTRLGIDHLLDQTASTLSYGQRQRVAIVRALCQPFEFLLLDEPFSHLDDTNVRAACELIAEEQERQGAGLLMVSLGEEYYFHYDKRLIL